MREDTRSTPTTIPHQTTSELCKQYVNNPPETTRERFSRVRQDSREGARGDTEDYLIVTQER